MCVMACDVLDGNDDGNHDGGAARARRGRWGIVVVGVFLVAVLLVSAFFLPIWTAEVIPYDQWRLRMWMPSWI